MTRATAHANRCVTFAAWLVAFVATFAQAAMPPWSLVPQPVEAHIDDAAPLTIASGAAIAVRGAGRARLVGIAQRFAALVADTRGLALHLASARDESAAIVFEQDPRAAVTGDAGYRVAVDASGIRVTARTAQGLFYGGVTVWQLLLPAAAARGAPAEIARGTIVDHPRFAWRALLLDSGRHFQSVAEIKQLIDWMALAKLNVLVWHLTEDQGWRLAIPAYPELTRIGACRTALGLDADLSSGADKPYCGFYTAADVREIVRFAAERFVTVVPDLDLPGHSQAAVASYPSLGVSGERPPVWSEWGVSPWLLKPDAKTLHFVDTVLDEVMRLFPSPYVSIGGDEAAKDQWNASPDVQAQMRRLGLANMDQLQGWFTQQVADYLVKHGRRPVGWDDELVAGARLPAAEIVMSWHGTDNGRVALEALRQGHDVVVTPQESLYFDHYASQRPDEWSGQAPAVTLQQAYDTDAIPRGASDAQARHVLGVQACLWSELMPTFADVQHALFPRLAALAELAWSPPQRRDWNDFLARLPAELARYRALGIGYADSALPAALAADAATPSASRSLTIDTPALQQRDGNELQSCLAHPEPMRVLGMQPAHGARRAYKADIGNLCWRWPRVTLDGVARVELAIERIAWQFGDDAANAVVRPKASAAGEVEVHLDTCDGALLATLPLAPAAAVQGPTQVSATISPRAGVGVRDVCLVATGDPRDGQWALARVAFRGREAP